MNECLKCIIIDILILDFKKYPHSFIQSAVFIQDVWPAHTLARTAHDCETGL